MPSALVILAEELPVHPREMAPALAPALGMVAYDVIAAFNRSAVLPFEDLDDRKAAAAVEALAAIDVPAAAVRAERLPEHAKIFQVHNADAEDDGLNVQTDLVGKMRKLAWDRMLVLSAASITITRSLPGTQEPSVGGVAGLAATRVRGLGGMHMRGGSLHRVRLPKKKKRTEHCDILALTPQGAPVEMQFRSNAFNFDYLGERLHSSAEENFRELAADVVGRATSARVAPGLRALVEEGNRPPKMKLGEFRSYNRWLHILASEGM